MSVQRVRGGVRDAFGSIDKVFAAGQLTNHVGGHFRDAFRIAAVGGKIVGKQFDIRVAAAGGHFNRLFA